MLKIKKFVVVPIFASLCLLSHKALAAELKLDRILVTVNQEAVTSLMFDLSVDQEIDNFKKNKRTPPPDEDIKVYIAKRLLDDAILVSEANSLEISAEPEEIEKEINSLKESSQFSEEQFDEYLKASNYNREQFRRNVADQIKKFKILETFVRSKIDMNEENILEYYNNQHFKPQTRYTLNTASFMLASENASFVNKALSILTNYYKNASSNGAMMNALSEDFKDDQSFQIQRIEALEGDLLKEFQQNLSGLVPGEMSKPFISPFGVHLIEVIDVGEAPAVEFSLIKEQVESAYYQQEFQKIYREYLTELVNKYDIDYRDQEFAGYIAAYNTEPEKYNQSFQP